MPTLPPAVAVRMYIPKFGRQVLIDPAHPLAVAASTAEPSAPADPPIANAATGLAVPAETAPSSTPTPSRRRTRGQTGVGA